MRRYSPRKKIFINPATLPSLQEVNFFLKKKGRFAREGNYRAINIRYCSNLNNNVDQDNTHNLKVEKVYENFKEDRIIIVKEEKGRSGVYLLINKVNNHTYVGSSTNLASRMRNYLNKARGRRPPLQRPYQAFAFFFK